VAATVTANSTKFIHCWQ